MTKIDFSGKALSEVARHQLLEELAHMPVEADSDDDVLRTFLPAPVHQKALDHRILVVRGERGAGKTALFNLLHTVGKKGLSLSKVISGAPDGRRLDGFAEGLDHPATQVLEEFAASAEPEVIRAFWLGHLVGRLEKEGVGKQPLPAEFAAAYKSVNEPGKWARVAREQLPALYTWLDTLERGAKETSYVVYDHLDRIGLTRPSVRQAVASGLLGLWMSLSQRYQRIRGKVLIREDLFQGTLSSFADASKLDARSVRIDWPAGRLLPLLVRRMSTTEGLASWLTAVPGIRFQRHPILGRLPDPEFDEATQKRFGTALVGRWMGAGPTKGASHTWLVNHLQDAHRRVTPRSLFVLLRGAAERALQEGPKAGYKRLLHPSELQYALEEKASEQRVTELREDYPVVNRLEGLRSQTLFLPRSTVLAKLKPGHTPDGYDSPLAAFDELMRLGVLSDRGGNRIDIPDVYRYAFGIKRKGGVRRPA